MMTLTENAEAGLKQIEDIFRIIDEYGRNSRIVDGRQDVSVKEGYWTHLWHVMSNLKSILVNLEEMEMKLKDHVIEEVARQILIPHGIDLNSIIAKYKDEDC